MGQDMIPYMMTKPVGRLTSAWRMPIN